MYSAKQLAYDLNEIFVKKHLSGRYEATAEYDQGVIHVELRNENDIWTFSYRLICEIIDFCEKRDLHFNFNTHHKNISIS